MGRMATTALDVIPADISRFFTGDYRAGFPAQYSNEACPGRISARFSPERGDQPPAFAGKRAREQRIGNSIGHPKIRPSLPSGAMAALIPRPDCANHGQQPAVKIGKQ